jgi:serine/threonine protein kinase
VGDHPRIIASYGLTEHGLILAYARNGSLYEYIDSKPSIFLWQRLQWCRQAAEAVEHIHQRNIIHCDVNLRNFLLDDNLDLLPADFQEMLKTEDGATLLDGLSRDCSKSFAPRSHTIRMELDVP